MPTKQWCPEYFAKVADTLIESMGCEVVLVGGQKDKKVADQVESCMKQTPVNLCGKTGLKVLTSVIGVCKLFITNDSGPMHIACVLGVNVIALFGPTTQEMGFFPYGKNSVVVEKDLECRPCSLHGGKQCPKGHFRCMKDVKPEEVLQVCEKIINQVPNENIASY